MDLQTTVMIVTAFCSLAAVVSAIVGVRVYGDE